MPVDNQNISKLISLSSCSEGHVKTSGSVWSRTGDSVGDLQAGFLDSSVGLAASLVDPTLVGSSFIHTVQWCACCLDSKATVPV